MASSLDPRLPVLVGVGQITRRPDRGESTLEPADLMAEALRRAEADSGGDGLLTGADQLLVVNETSWRYRNTSLAVAERIGASPRRAATSVVGGNLSGVMLIRAAADIAAGRCDVVLLCGGEATRSRSLLRKRGLEPDWSVQGDDVEPDETIGDTRPMVSTIERDRGVLLPVDVYPLFEVALRARLGLDVDTHRRRIGRLWSEFSSVAASNPYAWIREPLTAAEIAEPSDSNRMISFPYTKRLCSNNQVDQGAALVVTSVGAAERAGVPRDRWVFLHSGSEAVDHWHVSNRADLCSSPALRLAGRDAFALADITVDDLAHVDLYSCFPAAVQIAAIELGLVRDPRSDGIGWGGIGASLPLTVTGGMTFAGGPLNNYTTHGVATMVDRVRGGDGAPAMCTANGGYTTEHAVVIMGTEPPLLGYRNSEPQAEADASPSVDLDDAWIGAVTIESATIAHDRDGEPCALVSARTPFGARTWCRSNDSDLLHSIETVEIVGVDATRDADGIVHVD